MKNPVIAAITAAAALSLSATAYAGQQDMYENCRAALADAAGVDAAELTFKSISGGGVKRVVFAIGGKNADRIGECKVRRGEITDVSVGAA